MAKEKKPSLDEILNDLNEFERTLSSLSENMTTLKKKLVRNKELYGPDMNKWPGME